MLNVVLNNIHIYFFSFYKTRKAILEEIMKLQRAFLWGGSGEVRKINWVSWDIIHMAKEEGGLWVNHFGRFKRSFLSKWSWRILREKYVIWYDLYSRV